MLQQFQIRFWKGIFTSDLWIQLLRACLRQSTLKSPVKPRCWIKIAKYTSKHHLSDYFRKTLYLRYGEAAIQRCSLKKFVFFSIWVSFHKHWRITGLQGKGKDIYLTPHYHFHPLHRYLDISSANTAEGTPLHIASSRTQTGNLNASR